MKNSTAPISEAADLRRRGQKQSVGGPNSKAFLSFLDAAKLGDEEAQVTVGYDYAYGITGKVNVDEDFAGGIAPTDRAPGLLHSILGCSFAMRKSGQWL